MLLLLLLPCSVRVGSLCVRIPSDPLYSVHVFFVYIQNDVNGIEKQWSFFRILYMHKLFIYSPLQYSAVMCCVHLFALVLFLSNRNVRREWKRVGCFTWIINYVMKKFTMIWIMRARWHSSGLFTFRVRKCVDFSRTKIERQRQAEPS